MEIIDLLGLILEMSVHNAQFRRNIPGVHVTRRSLMQRELHIRN